MECVIISLLGVKCVNMSGYEKKNVHSTNFSSTQIYITKYTTDLMKHNDKYL